MMIRLFGIVLQNLQLLDHSVQLNIVPYVRLVLSTRAGLLIQRDGWRYNWHPPFVRFVLPIAALNTVALLMAVLRPVRRPTKIIR